MGGCCAPVTVEHYAVCPVLEAVVDKVLPGLRLGHPAPWMGEILLLTPRESAVRDLALACVADAFLRCHNSFRAHRSEPGASLVEGLLRGRPRETFRK